MNRRKVGYMIPEENNKAWTVCVSLFSLGFFAKLIYFIFEDTTMMRYSMALENVSVILILLLYITSFVLMLLSRKKATGIWGVFTIMATMAYECFPFISDFYILEFKFYKYELALQVTGGICTIAAILLLLYAGVIISEKNLITAVTVIVTIVVAIVNISASVASKGHKAYFGYYIMYWGTTVARILCLTGAVVFLEYSELVRVPRGNPWHKPIR